MSIAIGLPALVADLNALRVLGPGHPGRVVVQRGGTALTLDPAGAYQAVGSDMPRFQGAAQRLLVEEARTNALRNPRGAYAGTAGFPTANPPDYWYTYTSPGVTISFVATGSEDGIPYVDADIVATSGAYGCRVVFEGNSQVVCAPGQVWTSSFFMRLLAGSVGNVSFTHRVMERAANGTFIASTDIGANAPTAAPLTTQRARATRAIGDPSAARIVNGVDFNASSAFSARLRFGLPQLELGGVATSPMLPAAGSFGPASRAADLAVWAPPGGFGGSGTAVIRAMLPAAAPFSASQGLLQIDDGGDANRLLIRNTSGSATVHGVADSGGSTLAALSGGNMTAGTPFRAALAWAPGELAFCMNGGAVQSAAISTPAGLSRLLVGHGSSALTRAANGEVELIDFRPARLPNAMLQALSAAA
ncbi:hypothetical protein E0493_05270 [Roseomonas sp. M0104]|uniref:DUF2793 domain-containing protein n=1 Tax=Teichococcus coralli TaxID=2545983 RepID=A0A845BBN0_9PROT|nr:hypothetical protein [Pseudoroseomonas coralli]MXP62762.1 hypothetical protein [Pseudoroseomonas coralli]